MPPSSAAVLVVAHGVDHAAAATFHTLGQIGQALLATATPWQIRLLAPGGQGRERADRAGLKRHLAEVVDQDAAAILVALAGFVTRVGGEPALVTGPDHRAMPDEATLPLAWICERLRSCRAERVVVVASLAELVELGGRVRAGPDRAWLDALGTARPGHLVAVEPSGPAGAAGLAALHQGLTGAAVDPRTGTITLRSLGEHLARVAGIRLQPCERSDTLAISPPLAGPWDARLTAHAHTARSDRARPPADLVGSVLPGRFRIDGKLASGSFGTVYRARQLAVERDVAIKVLHGSVDPGSDVGRLFVHEIQSVGRIDHPNVVRIFQADITSGGCLFYAMELLAGEDLQRTLDREGPLPRERALGLIRQLLAALAAAHEAGLVHADVKPANLFVAPGKPEERLVLLDFGLARLRAPGQPAESAGGTPAYMAPEQLRDGRIDGRSDLFAAALVLVTLLTGWRRRGPADLVPPLDAIADLALRRVLARALAIAPGARFHTAGELAAALGGAAAAAPAVDTPPFRHLAAFTEIDRDRLRGRDLDLAALVEHVLYRRAVIYTAPSGVGKTSLLRAGLVARLEALGVDCLYLACRGGAGIDLARALWPDAAGVTAGVATRIASTHRRLAVIVDQLEAELAGHGHDAALRQLAELARLTADHDASIVLALREDYLASLLAHDGLESLPVIRLAPLGVAGAREAITGPLVERRIQITEELLAALLADLRAAAAAIAPELRWTGEAAVYPPHLQLACAVLYQSLAAGEAQLGLEHYRRLGGFDAIVGEYLERVLESELPTELTAAARGILLALVTPGQTRAFRTDVELGDVLGGDASAVLEALRVRGLVVRVRSPGGEAGWELVHDSLVPRVLAWLDRGDLARRRALELVRHHVRRSRPGRPSLLGPGELVELRAHHGVVSELDREWARRGGVAIRPGRLVELSRARRRRRRLGVTGAVASALGLAGLLAVRWLDERAQRRTDEILSKADLGAFTLELAAFDWDPAGLAARTVALTELPGVDWELFETAASDRLALAEPPAAIRSSRTALPVATAGARAWRVEARGGDALLRVSGRGRPGESCAPALIPLVRLPGYARRDRDRVTLRVQVPTCRATYADSVVIPAGPFVRGGAGEPPPVFDAALRRSQLPDEQLGELPGYAIDRTEVTNAAFGMFAAPRNATAIALPAYPPTEPLAHADEPAYPVAAIAWPLARAYCRFLGKDLPSDDQWQKALRGGTILPSGPNPWPRRNLPWGAPVGPVPANLDDTGPVGPAPAGSSAGDVSPYGVLDLAGNVQEWTRTLTERRFVVTRGCNWTMCTTANLVRFMAIPNARSPAYNGYELGFRCAMAR